ncbi:MAG: hypothetical protein J1E39_04285 [Eubacterium sp.]|nr:hypothetical protein [Eubacterium sp.]
MVVRLFGKQREAALLKEFSLGGRMPHGIIFTGENGIGKRTLALYCAQLMMCDAPVDGAPCGECLNCRKTAEGQHPDVIFARGEKYTKDSVRAIVHDSFYKPNDGGLKVYVFTQCEELTGEYQDLLLKIIEEPQESCRYIFTCENPSVMLETVMSRLIHIRLDEMSEKECADCLVFNGMERGEAEDAASRYGANPGRALAASGDEKLKRLSEISDGIAKALAHKDEYEALVLFSSAGDRKELFELIELLYDTVCRALIRTGYMNEGAAALAEKLPADKLYLLSEKLSEYAQQKKFNLSVKVTQCDICSELFSILA